MIWRSNKGAQQQGGAAAGAPGASREGSGPADETNRLCQLSIADEDVRYWSPATLLCGTGPVCAMVAVGGVVALFQLETVPEMQGMELGYCHIASRSLSVRPDSAGQGMTWSVGGFPGKARAGV